VPVFYEPTPKADTVGNVNFNPPPSSRLTSLMSRRNVFVFPADVTLLKHRSESNHRNTLVAVPTADESMRDVHRVLKRCLRV
jgi:hypothetical protein